MAEITKIEPLDGSNFQSWKYNMKLVLMERGLWGFVQGTESEPEPTASASVKNSYRLRSDKAYSLIALSVKTGLQVHISSATNPKTAWEILQKHFESVSITQVVRLNRKFYAASMEEGADLMQHITMMTSLAEQLRELEEEISSRKFATVILGSLPESYDNFVSSLNARTADELNWDSIKGPYIEECMKRKDKRDQQHSSNDALLTEKRKFSSRRRNTGNYSHNYQAGDQGRPGFRSRDSYDNTLAGRDDREKPRGPKCHKCKQFGHVVKNCPQNKKRGESYIADTDAVTEETKTHTIEDQLEEIALPASTRCELFE